MRNGGPLFRSPDHGLVAYSLESTYDPVLRGVLQWQKLEYVGCLAEYLGVEKETFPPNPLFSGEPGRYREEKP